MPSTSRISEPVRIGVPDQQAELHAVSFRSTPEVSRQGLDLHADDREDRPDREADGEGDPPRYLLTARALSEARVLMIPAETFREALDSEPRLSRALVDVLAEHWRLLVRQIKGLKLHSAAERLATYLVIRSDAREGAATIRLEEELRIVAARLGMTPESLSRAFTALRAHGVASRGRSVTIDDIALLRRMCRFEDME
jgi:CRP-like cAMP-binding protein